MITLAYIPRKSSGALYEGDRLIVGDRVRKRKNVFWGFFFGGRDDVRSLSAKKAAKSASRKRERRERKLKTDAERGNLRLPSARGF